MTDKLTIYVHRSRKGKTVAKNVLLMLTHYCASRFVARPENYLCNRSSWSGRQCQLYLLVVYVGLSSLFMVACSM